MDSNALVLRLAFLKKNVDPFYGELKEIAASLVGRRILFGRGASQTVLADVIEVVPHSLRIVVQNVDSRRTYDIDITKMRLKEVIILS